LESVRQTIRSLPAATQGPRLTWDDMLGAMAICLIVFLSTIPVILPFLFIDDVRPALRASNAVAIAMLFMCGYAFARCTGLRPWSTGIAMVAIGCLMVGVAIALGG
jgi:VIT1/CCC1 family predicted Fe2+/Mn2+ transporter